jgi:hypothetical protein
VASRARPGGQHDGFVYQFSVSKPVYVGVIAMHSSSLTADFDSWTHPSYEVRVRGTKMYLWGSAGVTTDIKFDKPILLHIRNDLFGEVVTFGTEVAGGTRTTIGTLEPGQCVSIPLQNISGVFATCVRESNVCCLIKE